MSPTLRVVPSVAGLLALCLTSPPARATDLDLADRLTGAGDRILSGAVLDRNGNYIWTLAVEPSVDAAAVEATGATIDWALPDYGFMAVRSPDPEFGERVLAVPGVGGAALTLRREEAALTSARVGAAATGEVDPDYPNAHGPDIYRENGQWPLYAIDAVDPMPADDTVSGWTPGPWKLAYDGTGITVGNADCTGPSYWCEPVDVRVDVDLPLWGVCALFGGSEEAGFCVFEEDLVDAGELCMVLGEIVGNEAVVEGDTCGLYDQSLADLYSAMFGYDYLNYGEIAPFFRPRKLHPDFDWYAPGSETTNDPSLGAPGGVVPIFGLLEDYEAYVEDRYLQYLMPTGMEFVNWQFEFVGATFALTESFAEALEAGEVGACSTADPRLPDPASLRWEPYSYPLFAPPFDHEGRYVGGGWNGYDDAGELRVILDPTSVWIDTFGTPMDAHGNGTAGPIAGRYRPDGPHLGAMRGVAPGVKLIQCSDIRRAYDDGVQIFNFSYLYTSEFKRRAYGTIDEDDLDALAYASDERTLTALSREVLFVASGGNYGLDWDHFRSEFGVREFFQHDPHALVVGGVAPRDYDWREDIQEWMPDAPGRPYDAYNQDRNLDRPMVFISGAGPGSGTCFGSRIDVVAPSGSFYLPPGTCEEGDWRCEWVAYNSLVWSTFVQEGWPTTEDTYHDGPHELWIGTSFSAPYTVGVAAVAAEAWFVRHGTYPSPSQLKSLVRNSADDRVGPTWDEVVEYDLETSFTTGIDTYLVTEEQIDKRGPDDWMGAGRVNASQAIELALK